MDSSIVQWFSQKKEPENRFFEGHKFGSTDFMLAHSLSYIQLARWLRYIQYIFRTLYVLKRQRLPVVLGFESIFNCTISWIYLRQVKEVSESSPAKEEKNESEAKDGAGEKEKGEKDGEMLKLHFKKDFTPQLKFWEFELDQCQNEQLRQIDFHQPIQCSLLLGKLFHVTTDDFRKGGFNPLVKTFD